MAKEEIPSHAKCPKCGHELTMMVQATIIAPARYSHELSKKNFRKKEVYLNGVSWETMDLLCNRCMYANLSYGHYVKHLKTQNDMLLKVLKEMGITVKPLSFVTEVYGGKKA